MIREERYMTKDESKSYRSNELKKKKDNGDDTTARNKKEKKTEETKKKGKVMTDKDIELQVKETTEMMNVRTTQEKSSDNKDKEIDKKMIETSSDDEENYVMPPPDRFKNPYEVLAEEEAQEFERQWAQTMDDEDRDDINQNIGYDEDLMEMAKNINNNAVTYDTRDQNVDNQLRKDIDMEILVEGFAVEIGTSTKKNEQQKMIMKGKYSLNAEEVSWKLLTRSFEGEEEFTETDMDPIKYIIKPREIECRVKRKSTDFCIVVNLSWRISRSMSNMIVNVRIETTEEQKRMFGEKVIYSRTLRYTDPRFKEKRIVGHAVAENRLIMGISQIIIKDTAIHIVSGDNDKNVCDAICSLGAKYAEYRAFYETEQINEHLLFMTRVIMLDVEGKNIPLTTLSEVDFTEIRRTVTGVYITKENKKEEDKVAADISNVQDIYETLREQRDRDVNDEVERINKPFSDINSVISSEISYGLVIDYMNVIKSKMCTEEELAKICDIMYMAGKNVVTTCKKQDIIQGMTIDIIRMNTMVHDDVTNVVLAARQNYDLVTSDKYMEFSEIFKKCIIHNKMCCYKGDECHRDKCKYIEICRLSKVKKIVKITFEEKSDRYIINLYRTESNIKKLSISKESMMRVQAMGIQNSMRRGIGSVMIKSKDTRVIIMNFMNGYNTIKKEVMKYVIDISGKKEMMNRLTSLTEVRMCMERVYDTHILTTIDQQQTIASSMKAYRQMLSDVCTQSGIINGGIFKFKGEDQAKYQMVTMMTTDAMVKKNLCVVGLNRDKIVLARLDININFLRGMKVEGPKPVISMTPRLMDVMTPGNTLVEIELTINELDRKNILIDEQHELTTPKIVICNQDDAQIKTFNEQALDRALKVRLVSHNRQMLEKIKKVMPYPRYRDYGKMAAIIDKIAMESTFKKIRSTGARYTGRTDMMTTDMVLRTVIELNRDCLIIRTYCMHYMGSDIIQLSASLKRNIIVNELSADHTDFYTMIQLAFIDMIDTKSIHLPYQIMENVLMLSVTCTEQELLEMEITSVNMDPQFIRDVMIKMSSLYLQTSMVTARNTKMRLPSAETAARLIDSLTVDNCSIETVIYNVSEHIPIVILQEVMREKTLEKKLELLKQVKVTKANATLSIELNKVDKTQREKWLSLQLVRLRQLMEQKSPVVVVKLDNNDEMYRAYSILKYAKDNNIDTIICKGEDGLTKAMTLMESKKDLIVVFSDIYLISMKKRQVITQERLTDFMMMLRKSGAALATEFDMLKTFVMKDRKVVMKQKKETTKKEGRRTHNKSNIIDENVTQKADIDRKDEGAPVEKQSGIKITVHNTDEEYINRQEEKRDNLFARVIEVIMNLIPTNWLKVVTKDVIKLIVIVGALVALMVIF